MVGLVPQLGDGASGPRHVDAGVRRLDALVGDLTTGDKKYTARG